MAKTSSLGLNASGDLDFSGGRLRKVEGADYLKQKVRSVIQFFLGEWYLDLTGVGVPYFELVFEVKDPPLNAIRSELQRHILGVQGIVSVTALDVQFDNRTRTLAVSYSAVGDLNALLSDTVEVLPP